MKSTDLCIFFNLHKHKHRHPNLKKLLVKQYLIAIDFSYFLYPPCSPLDKHPTPLSSLELWAGVSWPWWCLWWPRRLRSRGDWHAVTRGDSRRLRGSRGRRDVFQVLGLHSLRVHHCIIRPGWWQWGCYGRVAGERTRTCEVLPSLGCLPCPPWPQRPTLARGSQCWQVDPGTSSNVVTK